MYDELASQADNEMTEVESQVKQELVDLRSHIFELQNQVNVLRSQAINSVSATDHANEVATLRAEIADLRRLLTNTHSNNNSERSVSSTKLNVPTSNISTTSSRAGQVGNLQKAFEIPKGRVDGLASDHRTEVTFMSPTCQKRTSSEAGLLETGLAAELLAVSRYTSLVDAAGPEGALSGGDPSPQRAISNGSIKKMEFGHGERN